MKANRTLSKRPPALARLPCRRLPHRRPPTLTVPSGIAVDATNASLPNGSAGVVLGARVEIKGSAVGGIVIAVGAYVGAQRIQMPRHKPLQH